MSRRISTRFQRIAAASSIAVMGLVAFNVGDAHAEDGPVCEEPPPAQDGPTCEPLRITVVDPNGQGFLRTQIVLQLAL